MVSAELSEGISETLEILNNMEETYINKIPKKFKDFLEKNKSENYRPKIDYSKSIKDMKLKEKTKDILATIYMNYWCTKEEKEEYQKLLNENEEKYEEQLKEKYNPDNLFKKSTVIEATKEETIQKEVTIVEHKESIISKIINKIKGFFNSHQV